jgi:hypothetical protein
MGIFLVSAFIVAFGYSAYETKRNHVLWNRAESAESALSAERGNYASMRGQCLQWVSDLTQALEDAKAAGEQGGTAEQGVAETTPVDLDELPYEFARGGRPKKCRRGVTTDHGNLKVACSCNTDGAEVDDEATRDAIQREVDRTNVGLLARVRLAAASEAAKRGESPPFIPPVDFVKSGEAVTEQALDEQAPEAEQVDLTPDPPPEREAVATVPYSYSPDGL